ncbi:putative transposase [Mycobacterium xenopi 4042]|uniref:Putative transposase n=1 Tax=Mycobacterium xenopi 4042 TaxID=1299334 RepID=X7ZFR5_MYCXE|nr:putative transposase [Mycobacterium xenopi 4042]
MHARTPAEVLELAVALRRENPDRTAAAIQRILRTQLGWAPDERTLQRNFHRLGLTAAAAGRCRCSAGSKLPLRMTFGSEMHCTAYAFRCARRICSRSSMTILGYCRDTAGLRRRHRATGGGAAPGVGLPRRSQSHIC